MDILHAEKKAFLQRMSTVGSYSNSKAFYEGRIRFILEQHNFSQREQMLGMVLCAAMGDRSITVSDMLSLTGQVEAAHQKSLEENYRETWDK